ncbi:zcchc10 protein [Anaeramoeba flamelloides]|uniref:Zcchc10 protein n=1 Tax=Anaeramoeba flamelloides TaxID=1746091 RepID=A0ABQ8XAK5_9EUKA|nr:zcchc10 protein [Anaeramoeba flamelloides]
MSNSGTDSTSSSNNERKNKSTTNSSNSESENKHTTDPYSSESIDQGEFNTIEKQKKKKNSESSSEKENESESEKEKENKKTNDDDHDNFANMNEDNFEWEDAEEQKTDSDASSLGSVWDASKTDSEDTSDRENEKKESSFSSDTSGSDQKQTTSPSENEGSDENSDHQQNTSSSTGTTLGSYGSDQSETSNFLLHFKNVSLDSSKNLLSQTAAHDLIVKHIESPDLPSQFEILFYLGTYTQWGSIDLLELEPSVFDQIKQTKKEYLQSYLQALSWCCLGDFFLCVNLLENEKISDQKVILYFDKKGVSIGIIRANFKVNSSSGKKKGTNNHRRPRNNEYSFKSKWADLEFSIHSTHPRKILLKNKRSNTTNSKIVICADNFQIKSSIVFALLIYKLSDGKDKRIGKNPKVEYIDINNLNLLVLPPYKISKNLKQQLGEFRTIQRLLDRWQKKAKLQSKIKTKNLKIGFFGHESQKETLNNLGTKVNDDNLDTSSSSPFSSDEDYEIKKKQRQKKKKQKLNSTPISHLVSIRDFSHLVINQKKDTSVAPLIGGKLNLLETTKNQKEIGILQKKNEELFEKREWDLIEYDYFSDFGPKKYYLDGKVIFFVHAIVKRKMPFQNGLLWVNRKSVKIKYSKTQKTIKFTRDYEVKELENERVFKIQSRGKKKSQNNCYYLVARSPNERLLIMRTITIFHRNWLKRNEKKNQKYY